MYIDIIDSVPYNIYGMYILFVYSNNTLYIFSVQATMLLHEQVNGILETYQYVVSV